MLDFHLVWSLVAFGGFSELNRLTYPTNYLRLKMRALFKKGECYGIAYYYHYYPAFI